MHTGLPKLETVKANMRTSGFCYCIAELLASDGSYFGVPFGCNTRERLTPPPRFKTDDPKPSARQPGALESFAGFCVSAPFLCWPYIWHPESAKQATNAPSTLELLSTEKLCQAEMGFFLLHEMSEKQLVIFAESNLRGTQMWLQPLNQVLRQTKLEV